MRITSTDDVSLELHDFGGEGPPLLIAHATGFCAGAYLPMVRILAANHHVWALDFRAHGDSSIPASGDLTWEGMVDDVLAATSAIDAGPVYGFGHSMGGACLIAAEVRRHGTIRSAFVFEPIVVPDGWGKTTGTNPMAVSARRRRATFASHTDALSRYAHRPPLNTFRADALAAYVDHGFRESEDGVELKCTPEQEARVFEASGKPTMAGVGPARMPVVVAYGGQDGRSGPEAFAPDVAAALANGRGQQYPELSHFGPFQAPDTLARDAVAHFAEN